MNERMSDYSRRDMIAILTAAGLGGVASDPVAARGRGRGRGNEHDHEDGPTLNRLATTVRGAEITGMFLTQNGRFFFNVQHPDATNDDPYDKGTVGALTGANLNNLPEDFASVQVPENGEESETVHTAVGRHQPLANGGDPTDSGRQFGVPYSAAGDPMTDGNVPDYNGFVPADHPNEAYLFTNWETAPGMVSRLHLRMRGRRGKSTNHEWEVLGKENVDFRPVEGTWNNCFGTVSPWGTPLTSEEYEPDAKAWFEPDEQTYGNREQTMKEYLGYFGNAYRYGYIVELEEPTGDPTPKKHYAMGRFAHENAVVMPDRRTAYMSDDGTGTVFFKFVADEAGDLSSGTLYAAKANQESSDDPATAGFALEWIELAHGDENEIGGWIADYDDQDPENGPDYITEREVEQWANGNADDDRVAFLESRRAAGAVGATDEFRKMEGVNIKRDAQPGEYLYMAMSEINETMSDEEDDVQLSGNDYGAVYRMQLDENYDVGRMEPVITGGPEANICGGCPYDASPNSASTVCADCSFNPNQEEASGVLGTHALGSNSTVDPENTIANPDNIVVMDDGRVIIGEDSGMESHDPPNMIWVYNPDGSGRPDNDRARGR
jgi:secreted PhoX family phosphatase